MGKGRNIIQNRTKNKMVGKDRGTKFTSLQSNNTNQPTSIELTQAPQKH